MRVVAMVLLALLIGLAVGCSKECDCVSPASSRETIFALDFDLMMDWETGEPAIHASFFTTDCSEIPSVTVNGHKMNELELYPENGSIEGSMHLPSGATVFNYNISAHGQTTSGSIAMPDPASNVVCNEVVLNACSSSGCPNNYVPASTTFDVSWDCSVYDYFVVSLSSTDNCYCDTFSTTVSKNIALRPCCTVGPNEYFLSFGIFKGARFREGETPNVSGAYGKGYVRAGQGVSYQLSLNEGTQRAVNALNGGMVRDSRFEEQKKNIRDFILAQ
jgi:hypothetical protein